MTVFEPYPHQVGGHCAILKLDGRVCKPLIPKEYEFYQTITRDCTDLLCLVPQFYGCITIVRHTKQDSQDKSSQDLYVELVNRDLCNADQSVQQLSNISALAHLFTPSTFEINYIVLQDLTAGMSKPCAMDMKIGTRQRYPTSTILGFRLCGMRVQRKTELYAVDRLFGRGLTPETVEGAVSAFLFDGQAVRIELIPSILESLTHMISSLKYSPYRFYTSSLLFTYEGDRSKQPSGTKPRVDIKIIDFAHATRRTETEGLEEDGVLFGLKNLISLFTHIAERHANHGVPASTASTPASCNEHLKHPKWELNAIQSQPLLVNTSSSKSDFCV